MSSVGSNGLGKKTCSAAGGLCAGRPVRGTRQRKRKGRFRAARTSSRILRMMQRSRPMPLASQCVTSTWGASFLSASASASFRAAEPRDHLARRQSASTAATSTGVGVGSRAQNAKAVARRHRLERLTVRIERSWFVLPKHYTHTPSVPVLPRRRPAHAGFLMELRHPRGLLLPLRASETTPSAWARPPPAVGGPDARADSPRRCQDVTVLSKREGGAAICRLHPGARLHRTRSRVAGSRVDDPVIAVERP